MKKSHISVHNAVFSGRDSVAVYCLECHSLIAIVYREHISYIKISFRCKCGAFGCLEEADDDILGVSFRRSRFPLYAEGLAYFCPKDSVDVFLVRDDVPFFAYKLGCGCCSEYSGVITGDAPSIVCRLPKKLMFYKAIDETLE